MKLKLNTFSRALALVGLLALLPLTQAQEAKPRDVDALVTAQRLKTLHSVLNLSDVQQEKIRPMLYEEGKSIRTMREDEKISQQEKFAKQKEIHAACMAKIKPVLTAEQMEKLDNWQQKAAKKPAQKPK